MLTRGQDSELGVLNRVQLVGETLDERLVQSEQIRVLSLIECLLLEVLDQLVTDLMPQSTQGEITLATI